MFRTPFRRHPVAAFFVLTYAISWTVWSPLVVTSATASTRTGLLIVVGGFGPAAAAALVTWLAGGSVRAWLGQVARWRVSLRWYGVAFLLPVGYVLLASGLDVVLLGAPVDVVSPGELAVYPLSVLFVFLLGGGQEEPGWRGFALPRLQSRYSALVASLLVGVGWLGWHLPLFAVPGSSQAALPLPFYVVSTVALSVVFTWLYNNTGGSVLLAMLLHASANAVVALPLTGSDRMLTTTGYGLLAGVVALVAAALVAVYGVDLSRDGVPSGEAGRERRRRVPAAD